MNFNRQKEQNYLPNIFKNIVMEKSIKYVHLKTEKKKSKQEKDTIKMTRF